MDRRTTRAVWLLLAISVLPQWADAAQISGQLSLELQDAVFQTRKDSNNAPGPLTYLELDLICQNGQWREDVYGWGWNFDRAEHYGKLLKATVQGDAIHLETHIEIDGDQWVAGGMATYTIDVNRGGDKLAGRYKGRFRDRDVQGEVTGTIRPLPKLREGYLPPEPGEHPRLLIRKRDIPALKQKAQTDWGKPMIEKIKAMTDDGPAMGLMYVLTGEPQYADRCREFLDREFKDTTGGTFNLGHEHGRRQQRMGITYDLAYDGLTEQFRSKIASYLTYYNSRSSLRSTTFSGKTNLLAGSNYMAFIVAGPYTSQAALWDAPGAFPAEPNPPVMAKLDPPAGFSAGKGVPTSKLEPGKTLTEWLFAGPFFVYTYREDYLVLKPRHKEPTPGAWYQQTGQDFLASIGGAQKARPELGTTVNYRNREKAFAPLDPKSVQERDGVKVVDVWAANGSVPCSTGYYYAAVQCDAPGWYKVLLEPDKTDAQDCNLYIGGNNDKFNPKTAAFRLDATLYLAGQDLHHGDAVYLAAGTYPAMMVATTMQYKIALQPRFQKTNEPEAKDSLAARQKQFDGEIQLWEHYFEAYFRRPLYVITDRKVHRYDIWAQGDGGYKNESGSYHDYTMPTANLLAHVYLNMTGEYLPNTGMNTCCYVATDGGNAHQFATGFSSVPDAYKPAVLWAWKNTKDFGADPVMTFLNYPLDMEAKNPQGVLPSPYVDKQQGWYMFRNGWRGDQTTSASIYYKSFPVTGWNRPEHGSFEIKGLGRTWAPKGHDRSGDRYLEENVVQFPLDGIAVNDTWQVGPGRVTYFSGKPDGSGVVSGSLDEVLLGVKADEKGKLAHFHDFIGRFIKENIRDLGLRDFRSFAVDYGGSSGAPGLFAVVDKTTGGKGKYWQMNLPQGRDGQADVKIDGQTFTVQQGDATLEGTFIAPARAEIKHVRGPQKLETIDVAGKPKTISGDMHALFVSGGDGFFVVMTLQKGPAPGVKVEGDGLAAKVTIGGQKVSFDGEKIVMEK